MIENQRVFVLAPNLLNTSGRSVFGEILAVEGNYMLKIQRTLFSVAALAVSLLASSGAHAYWSFDQAGVTGIGDTAPTGVTVSLSGVYAANTSGNTGFASGATWSAGALSYFAGSGQGMYSGTDSTSPFHALDNNGNTEAVILQFSSSVVLSSIGLGYTSDNLTATTCNGSPSTYDCVDVSLFRWQGSGTPTGSPTALVGQGAAAMTGWQLVGNYGDMALDTSNPYNLVNSTNQGSSWWMISAYNSGYSSAAAETRGALDNGNDYFKLYAVAGSKCTSTVAGVCGPGNQTPEPSALVLMGAGVLGMIGVRRRQRNPATVVV